MIKNLLLDYVRYNLWVNTRLVELFKNADDDIVSHTITSSFPSIRDTLIHLWDVETLWLARLRGVSPKSFPSENFNGSNAEVYEKLVAISTEFVHFVESQNDDFFDKILTFSILSAKGEFHQKSTDMIHHCMNHQTFHRGQIITMARQLGVTQFPRTDFIIFKREMEA
jgi:uncharacterized damage-inducible protein DinB